MQGLRGARPQTLPRGRSPSLPFAGRPHVEPLAFLICERLPGPFLESEATPPRPSAVGRPCPPALAYQTKKGCPVHPLESVEAAFPDRGAPEAAPPSQPDLRLSDAQLPWAWACHRRPDLKRQRSGPSAEPAAAEPRVRPHRPRHLLRPPCTSTPSAFPLQTQARRRDRLMNVGPSLDVLHFVPEAEHLPSGHVFERRGLGRFD